MPTAKRPSSIQERAEYRRHAPSGGRRLTARELIKGRVLETSPVSAREAAEDLAASVGADVVQVVGRNFVLYRPNKKGTQNPPASIEQGRS